MQPSLPRRGITLSIEQQTSTESVTSTQTIIAPTSVARNSIVLFSFQMITKVFGFFTSVLLANYFGAHRFGEYNYAFALTALFVPLCDMGMDYFLLKEIPRLAKESASTLASTVLKVKFIVSLVILVLIAVTAGLMELPGSTIFVVVLLSGVVTVFRAYWTTFGLILRGINKVQIESILFSLIRFAEFTAVAISVLLHGEMIVLLAILSFINIAACFVTYGIVKKRHFELSFRFNNSVKDVLMGGLPFALTGLVVSIYFNFDTVLVSKIINDEAAGIYRAAYNLILPLTMITAAISGAVFPYISQNYRTHLSEVSETVRKSLSYLLMIALPIAVITTLTSKEIIAFLFKPEYAQASVSLMILVWFLPIGFVTNLFGHVLGAMDMQAYVLKVSAINVVVNIVANVLLIPVYAQNGAAVVTVLTESVGIVLLSYKIRTHFHNIYDSKQIGAMIVSTLPAIAFLMIQPGWHVLLLLGISVLLYLAGLLTTKTLQLKEITTILSLIKSRAIR